MTRHRHVPHRIAAATALGPALLALAFLAGGSARTVVAAGNELRLELPTTVQEGGTVVARVVQNAQVESSAAQATVTFDPALLQVVSVSRGEAYAEAPLFLAGDDAAIAAANASGRLATVAAAFVPPASVPPGPAEFLVVEFRAVGCGTAEIGLPVGAADASMLDGRADTYGKVLEVSATGGSVTLCADASSSREPVAETPAPAPDAADADSPPGGAILVAGAGIAAIGLAAAAISAARRRRPA